uniref:NOT2/NOT3/NOT5 C-terminal domain-containing protein n=1 Tax=Euplotes harpa TaxID=151035 RepID=A0A7S3JKN1_9SPIT|mmetsp:Transcript_418/g.420  ORF Transcript_418/g.420 Transcript_418/m.420 type:complete len:120 (+) Transcript_418:681-1040(+)
MDLSKVFAEHDETLLYIFYTMTNEEIQYRSAQELGRRGWLYNDLDQTWSVTRKGGSKSKSKKPKQPYAMGNKGEENTELSRYKFDIEQWRVVEFSLSEYKQQENQPQKRFDDLNSLPTE